MLLFWALQNQPTNPFPLQQTVTGSTGASSNNFTLNMPSPRPDGDLYIAVVSVDSPVDTIISNQASFNLIQHRSSADNDLWIGWRVGASEPASYTFAATGSASEWTGAVLQISNFKTSAPIDISAATDGGAGGSSAPPLPSITTVASNTLVYGVACTDGNNSATPYEPLNWYTVLQQSVASGNLLQIAYEYVGTPATVSGDTFHVSAGVQWATAAFAIAPFVAGVGSDAVLAEVRRRPLLYLVR